MVNRKIYRNVDGWIPQEDIDGIDAKEGYVADINNMDYGNGYIANAKLGSLVDLPVNVLADITNGYELLSSKYFIHSVQDGHFVYLLWQTESLKVYLDNTLLDLDEQNSSITFEEKPYNINYNFVNDQLKINLNCTARYNVLNEDVIMNLTLCYLDTVSFMTGVERSAGWYIFPRWLGWSWRALIGSATGVESVTEDAQDSSYIHNMTLIGYMTYDTGNKVFISSNWGDIPIDGIQVTGLCNIKQIRVSAYAEILIEPFTQRPLFSYLQVKILKGTEVLYDSGSVLIGSISAKEFVFDVGVYGTNLTLQILGCIGVNANVDNWGITSFTIYGYDNTDFSIIGLNFDGQRFLIGNPNTVVSLYDDNVMTVSEASIDWRIAAFEFYIHSTSQISYLVSTVSLTGWTSAGVGDYIKKDMLFDSDEVITLNNKYNLPYDARVDNQRIINSEVEHKGRVYFVNGNNKVYQSNVVGTAVIQPDSFPYDEEQGFGFFITNRQKLNTGLAVSPINELLVYTSKGGFYRYIIQAGAGTVYRTLQLINGDISLSSPKSLTTYLGGEPGHEAVIWIDNNGIYYYVGGNETPVNLIQVTHKRWWETYSIVDKQNAVGCYNPQREEYFLFIKNILLIFEIPFKKFRKYTLPIEVKEFIGVIDNVVYFLTKQNNIYKMDYSLVVSGNITFHWNVPDRPVEGGDGRLTEVSEFNENILMELFSSFSSYSQYPIYAEVWVDHYKVKAADGSSDKYYMFPSQAENILLMPLSVRFRKIKIKLSFPVDDDIIKMRSLGYGYEPLPTGLRTLPIQVGDVEQPYGDLYGN